jgi:dTDP-3-amino-3,4,6-trideoxy-alpha-D-glucopyranose N,N-dimethyltransferase
MEYSREHAEVYEFIFRFRSRAKDWPAEAEEITRLVRDRFPKANSLLDVACGTGAHLETFSKHFDYTAGLELSAPMREIAEKRLPGLAIHAGDMRGYDLDRRFDAVSCLFGSIGYMRSNDELDAAIGCMATHLVPGGVVVVEPWWFPNQFIEGYFAGDLAQEPDRVVARVTHSTRQGRSTRLEVRFVVAEPTGITDFTVLEIVTLFTRAEYEDAFQRAGCSVEYLEGGFAGRGLFVGTRE